MKTKCDGALTHLRDGIATPEEQKLMHTQLVNTVGKLDVAQKHIAALEARRMLVRIKTSSDAVCAESRCCFNTHNRHVAKTAWVDKHDLFVADGRAFALVTTVDRVFFMDCITGSLYELGECLTGAVGRTGFRRNRVLAEKILMAAGSGDDNGDDDGDE